MNSINLYDMKHSKESDSMMIKTEASHASLLEFIKNRSLPAICICKSKAGVSLWFCVWGHYPHRVLSEAISFDSVRQYHQVSGCSSPLQYSWLKNSMDWEAWWATVLGVAKNQAWRSGWAGACTRAHTHTHTFKNQAPSLIPESPVSLLSASTGSHRHQMLSKSVSYAHLRRKLWGLEPCLLC